MATQISTVEQSAWLISAPEASSAFCTVSNASAQLLPLLVSLPVLATWITQSGLELPVSPEANSPPEAFEVPQASELASPVLASPVLAPPVLAATAPPEPFGASPAAELEHAMLPPYATATVRSRPLSVIHFISNPAISRKQRAIGLVPLSERSTTNLLVLGSVGRYATR